MEQIAYIKQGLVSLDLFGTQYGAAETQHSTEWDMAAAGHFAGQCLKEIPPHRNGPLQFNTHTHWEKTQQEKYQFA